MNFDVTAIQDLFQRLLDAVRAGNLAAILGVLVSAYLLWQRLRATPVTVQAVEPIVTGQRTVDAALTLLNSDAKTPAERALVKAVAEKHAG